MSAVTGSSPLTRGKHTRGTSFRPHRGLIPAHAGKTQIALPSASNFRAHPRSRGENFGLEEDSGLVDGSSPLTRGKPVHIPERLHAARLIPAHAGKTYQLNG